MKPDFICCTKLVLKSATIFLAHMCTCFDAVGELNENCNVGWIFKVLEKTFNKQKQK